MITQLFTTFAAPCAGGDFLLFPKWHKYLDGQYTTNVHGVKSCIPSINHINDVWLVVTAVIELFIRVGALIALAYVIYGSIQYITSQGDPSKTATARSTILNALTGLIIAVTATGFITFVAGRFH